MYSPLLAQISDIYKPGNCSGAESAAGLKCSAITWWNGMYGEDIREKHNFLPICVHLVNSFKMSDEWNEESKINNNNTVLSEM